MIRANCIDLRERFGSRYRTERYPAYHVEYGPNARRHDPWLLNITGKHGHIYPHGGEMLGAATNRRGRTATRIARLPCTTVMQEGDDGINAIFNVEHFETVAEIMKPKRQRRLSPEHKAKLAAAGRRALAKHRNSNRPQRDRRRAQTPQPDSQAA